jgi:hypothetical protein
MMTSVNRRSGASDRAAFKASSGSANERASKPWLMRINSSVEAMMSSLSTTKAIRFDAINLPPRLRTQNSPGNELIQFQNTKEIWPRVILDRQSISSSPVSGGDCLSVGRRRRISNLDSPLEGWLAISTPVADTADCNKAQGLAFVARWEPGLAIHGWRAHSTLVMPFPSVMVKMRSSEGSFTFSTAPEGQ